MENISVMPNFETIVPESGHLIGAERSKEVNAAILDFLQFKQYDINTNIQIKALPCSKTSFLL